ncbi:MAG: MBL fold metallo-hydrolase [Promethearchaeota archaeon]
MVKLSFLGSCREVGRSAILVESEKTGDSVLLDYGVKMSDKDDNFPEHCSPRDLSAIVVSHSHIDHVGGVPIFYISGNVPLYMTELTFHVSNVLLSDMLKISEFFLPFDYKAVIKMRRSTRFLKYNNRQKIGEDTYITLHNSGHIPGSAMTLVEMDGKKILYTSDMNSIQTQLMSPAIPPHDKLDALITESTYGTTNHDPRETVEKEFIEDVSRILDNQGQVLIPAFGVSRSQEILMVLRKFPALDKYPVTCDGMARKIAMIYKKFPAFFRNYSEMTDAFINTNFIDQRNRFFERSQAKKRKGIVVAPSGMLKGGTARMYAENLIDDPNSAIYLVSFQIPESPGDILVNEQKYVLDKKNPGKKENVLSEVKLFSFSSHSDQKELIKFAEGCQFSSKEKQVFVVHGDEEVSVEYAEELKKHGFKASAPEKADKFEI